MVEKYLILKKKIIKNKKILITGHTGFIGSWLTLYLSTFSNKIYGVSNLNGAKGGLFNLFKLNKKIKHFKFDLNNKKKTFKLIKKVKPDIIIHLAAYPLVLESYSKAETYIKNNFLITLNLLESIKSHKPELFINFTSDKVYNIKNNFRKKENDVLGVNDPYSFSKACSDNLTLLYSNISNNSKTKFINLRCGNIIGGGDWNKNRIIPDIMKSLFKKKKIYLRNPMSVRPWTHIGEFLMCIVLILSKKINFDKYSAFNIGPKRNSEIKVVNLTKKIIKLSKYKNIKIIYKKNSLLETKILKLNSNKIFKKIQWVSKFNIDEKCKLTFDWYEDFFKKKNMSNIALNQIKLFEQKYFSK